VLAGPASTARPSVGRLAACLRLPARSDLVPILGLVPVLALVGHANRPQLLQVLQKCVCERTNGRSSQFTLAARPPAPPNESCTERKQLLLHEETRRRDAHKHTIYHLKRPRL
jgi:hypothetical protein